MEKIEILENVDFDMEVQCNPNHCNYDCLEPNGHCSSNTLQTT
ncbi:hypothetical protein MF628_07400 [Paenibacillus polymyxa]|nr:hypothetical protein [Paenibacillus polymyxa]UZP80629.1 hypothetical protein MF628_07400 [Paenibacillus polymyxa]